MAKIPHIITSLRILLSGMLLGIEPFSPFFLLIYFLCGLSDICDGYLARRLHVASDFGTLLDSLADLFLYVYQCLFCSTFQVARMDDRYSCYDIDRSDDNNCNWFLSISTICFSSYCS